MMNADHKEPANSMTNETRELTVSSVIEADPERLPTVPRSRRAFQWMHPEASGPAWRSSQPRRRPLSHFGGDSRSVSLSTRR